jgi:hypothetical protein
MPMNRRLRDNNRTSNNKYSGLSMQGSIKGKDGDVEIDAGDEPSAMHGKTRFFRNDAVSGSVSLDMAPRSWIVKCFCR